MSKPRLVDEVRGLLPKKGIAPWYTKLPPDLLDELEDVRKQYRTGKLGGTKTGTCYALSTALKARGVNIGIRGVQIWLESD